MTIKEIMESITVGFGQPKLYKRSVWNKAKKVMEFLCENTDGDVFRHDFGPGKEKYSSVSTVEKQKPLWALLYKRSLGEAISLEDAMPELKQISEELGIKLNSGTVVLDEYFKRHPQDRKN